MAGGPLADEGQSFEVAATLGVRQVSGTDVVAGQGEEEGGREYEKGLGHGAQEIVANAEAEVEASELVLREHGKVMRPHLAVVEPGLVFDLAGEKALDTADGVGRPFRGR